MSFEPGSARQPWLIVEILIESGFSLDASRFDIRGGLSLGLGLG